MRWQAESLGACLPALPSPPLLATQRLACAPMVARCSVLFNFLGRDFFNALSAKDQVGGMDCAAWQLQLLPSVHAWTKERGRLRVVLA